MLCKSLAQCLALSFRYTEIGCYCSFNFWSFPAFCLQPPHLLSQLQARLPKDPSHALLESTVNSHSLGYVVLGRQQRLSQPNGARDRPEECPWDWQCAGAHTSLALTSTERMLTASP